ncbi:DUF4215 domain-containing protein, partial [Nanoarchaeota archaeon]
MLRKRNKSILILSIILGIFLLGLVSSDGSCCGDGELNFGEECDDGNLINGDGCDNKCQIEEPEPFCGDGEVNQQFEECDGTDGVGPHQECSL